MRTKVGIFMRNCMPICLTIFLPTHSLTYSLWRGSSNASSCTSILEHTLCNALFCICIHKEATKRMSHPQGLPITVNRVIQPHNKTYYSSQNLVCTINGEQRPYRKMVIYTKMSLK